MEKLNLVQGSEAWLQYRATKLNASDAPAMMDQSKYKSRNELLREHATGIAQEFDAQTQKIFDNGHRFEALARSRAEEIIGEDLAPLVGFEGDLSASFDGITFMEDVIFEHKTLNDEIRQAQSVNDLHLQYHIQMEQQLLVSGAEKCLFHATKWSDDNTLLEEVYFWYEPNLELRAQIVAGWKQFKKDLESYVFIEIVEPPKAEEIRDLPAVTIQVKGELTLSNLNDVTPLFDKFLAEAKTTLITDNDFAIAEAESKIARETAKKCRLTAKAVVDQISTVSEAVKTLELYADKFDKLALLQEKAVKEQKETRKTIAKLERESTYAAFISDLEKTIAPIRLMLAQQDKPDFVSAMKNQRNLNSLYNKLDSELARAKIAATTQVNDIQEKLSWCKESSAGYGFLFNDLQQIIYKQKDDFKLLITSRIEQHKKNELEKLELQRLQIEAEAKQKAEAEQAKKLEAEREKVRAEEQAKITEQQRLDKLELEATRAKQAQEQAAIDAQQKAKAEAEALRKTADHIEQGAQYADRSEDRNAELAGAAKLRKQADDIELSFKDDSKEIEPTLIKPIKSNPNQSVRNRIISAVAFEFNCSNDDALQIILNEFEIEIEELAA